MDGVIKTKILITIAHKFYGESGHYHLLKDNLLNS